MQPEPFFKPFHGAESKVGVPQIELPQRGFPKLGLGNRPKAQASAPAEEVAPLPESSVPEKPKPKSARLFNPRWEADKVGFNEETPVSVELELPSEVAHKKKVSFELFAKTPKGPERISQGEAMAEGGKATLKIPVYIPNFKDEDGNRPQSVEYYFIARHSEAEPLDGSNAPKVVEEMADRVLEMHILQSLTFATDRSFIRASESGHLKSLGQAVKDWKGRHSDCKLVVFGHADAVGEELGNKRLSERRAKSVQAYLANDAKPWEELYGEENWGLAAVQELLKHLGHDPGIIDGQDGPKTRGAVKDFQGKKGLAATGAVDARTREALFLAYFGSNDAPGCSGKDFDVLDGKAYMGCGEFNLIENVQEACEANRRVAVVLLKVSKNFPIHYPCKQGAILPCQKQAGLKGERRTAGFKCRFYDNLVIERKGAGPQAGKLNWLGVKDGEQVKQYVNLASDKTGQGPDRRLEIEVEGASDGAKVYWKVAAGKDNSKRNEPKAGLKPDARGTLTEFKNGVAELETEVKGGKASVMLACGLAGGDRFKVEVGLGKGKADGTVTVVNWRKLYYEIMAPAFMPFEERMEPGGGKVMDFPAAMLKRLEERGSRVFVEYKLYKSHIFSEAEAPDSSVFSKEQLLLNSGKRAYLLTDHTFKSYPKNFDKGMSPRSIGLKLCNRNFFYESFNPNLIDENVELNSKTMRILVKDWYKAYYLPKSAENGRDSMRTLTWTAKIDPAKHPNHPAVAGGKARSGVLSLDCIIFTNFKEFEIELPSKQPDDPGSLVGASVTSEKCPIEVRMQFESPSEGLGLAGQGAQTGENLVVYNSDSPESFVDVLLHELGHSMGQTVFASQKPPKGLPMPKTVSETDSAYASHGSLGHVYTAHGHSGPHCAYGLTDVQKNLGKYGGQGGTCIMFGENTGFDPSSATTGFCPQCSDYIKARDLRDLTAAME